MTDDKTNPEAAPHEHGKMDISDHERTFEGFMRLGSIGATVAILALIFVALVNS
ncbi:MAG: aa3-type cytochrome c oxidase subunit IV [Pseudomonadota bacterium]